MTHPLAALIAGVPDYDAGLLNDYGGGNVDWWQDYLRAEIGRANEAWRENVLAALEAATPPDLVEAGKVLEGVTPGPWLADETSVSDHVGLTLVSLSMSVEDEEIIAANARFIAWCREGVPALIALATAQAAQIAGLTKERDELRDMLERAQHVVPDLYTKWHEKAASLLKGSYHD